MRTEAVSNSAIPTPLDYLDTITARMVGSASSDCPDPEIIEELATVITTDPVSDDDMLRILAFAQGCYAAAEIYRPRDSNIAALHTAMGQDLIARATQTFASLMAIGIAYMGVTRH